MLNPLVSEENRDQVFPDNQLVAFSKYLTKQMASMCVCEGESNGGGGGNDAGLCQGWIRSVITNRPLNPSGPSASAFLLRMKNGATGDCLFCFSILS